MNFVSLTHRGPLPTYSLLRKISHARCTRQLTFFTHHVAPKPQISYFNRRTMALGSYIAKRFHSDTVKKAPKVGLHNHSSTWISERIFSLGSFTSFVAMFLYPCENAELFFAFVVAVHAHLGVEAIMVDYLRPAVVGNFVPKLIPVFSVLVSGTMLLSLAWIAVYGNGIAGSLQQLWYLDPTKEPYDAEDSKLHKFVE